MLEERVVLEVRVVLGEGERAKRRALFVARGHPSISSFNTTAHEIQNTFLLKLGRLFICLQMILYREFI